MAEALLADVSSVVPEVEVAVTMLVCGTSAVAVSVPVGLMLWGAEESDVPVTCGVTDGGMEEMVELSGVVVAVSTAAGDSVEVLVGGTVAVPVESSVLVILVGTLESGGAVVELVEIPAVPVSVAARGTVVLDVDDRYVESVGAELAVDPVSEVTDATTDEGAAESSTDCAEDATDSIEDATEAADDSADVIEETSEAAAVWATDSRELATDNTDVAAEPADDRTESAADVMEAAEPSSDVVELRLVDKPIVMPVLVEVETLPSVAEAAVVVV